MTMPMCQICESSEQVTAVTRVRYVCPECMSAMRAFMFPSATTARMVRQQRNAEKATA